MYKPHSLSLFISCIMYNLLIFVVIIYYYIITHTQTNYFSFPSWIWSRLSRSPFYTSIGFCPYLTFIHTSFYFLIILYFIPSIFDFPLPFFHFKFISIAIPHHSRCLHKSLLHITYNRTISTYSSSICLQLVSHQN